jgi:two-component system KDP operon response regulator KdpE
MTEVGRVLLVDDEPQIVRVLEPSLRAAGFDVSTAADGTSALRLLASEGFDAVLLDLGLPDMDGLEVIARIREWSELPILVLSARDREAEKIAALDEGADDFVNKPFGMGELLARVRAMLRGRERRFATKADFEVGDLQVNFAARRVSVQGDEVHLSPREYDLLRTLARYAGRVLTHKQLVAAVWGPAGAADSQTVRVLVGQVRQKIEVDPSRPQILLTEPGVGYRLVDTPPRDP